MEACPPIARWSALRCVWIFEHISFCHSCCLYPFPTCHRSSEQVSMRRFNAVADLCGSSKNGWRGLKDFWPVEKRINIHRQELLTQAPTSNPMSVPCGTGGIIALRGSGAASAPIPTTRPPTRSLATRGYPAPALDDELGSIEGNSGKQNHSASGGRTGRLWRAEIVHGLEVLQRRVEEGIHRIGLPSTLS
jgi:hypothetical protein